MYLVREWLAHIPEDDMVVLLCFDCTCSSLFFLIVLSVGCSV